MPKGKCPACGSVLTIPERLYGKQKKCPKCGQLILLGPDLITNPVNSQPAGSSPGSAQATVEPPPVNSGPRSNGPASSAASPESNLVKPTHKTVPNPVKEHGVLRMGLAGALCLLALLGIFLDPTRGFRAFIALGIAGFLFVSGLRAYISYLLPEGFPANLDGWRRDQKTDDGTTRMPVLDQLFDERRGASWMFERSQNLLTQIGLWMFPRFHYLTPAQRPWFRFVGILPVLITGYFFATAALISSGYLPLMGAAALLLIAAALYVHFTAFAALVPAVVKDNETVTERAGRLTTPGNPDDLYAFLREEVLTGVGPLRPQEEFHTRVDVSWSGAGGANREQTNNITIRAVYYAETQPLLMPENGGATEASQIMERGGAAILAAGWFAALLLPSASMLEGSMAIGAAVVGQKMLSLAYWNRFTFRFRSYLLRLKMTGSANSDTTYGSTQFVSNVQWKLHLAGLKTEASSLQTSRSTNGSGSETTAAGLVGQRYIVETTNGEQVRELSEYIEDALHGFRDVREKAREQHFQDHALREQISMQAAVVKEHQLLSVDAQKELFKRMTPEQIQEFIANQQTSMLNAPPQMPRIDPPAQ